MVKDIRPGSTGGVSAKAVVCGSDLVFQANDGVSGAELWAMELPVTRHAYLPLLLR